MKVLSLNKKAKRGVQSSFLLYLNLTNFEKDKNTISHRIELDFSNYKNIRKRLIPIRMRKIIENPIYKYLKYFSLLM